MEPDEIERSAAAAQTYVDRQMSPADLVAVVSLGDAIAIDQDFTSDKAALKKALKSFNPGAGQGFEAGDTGPRKARRKPVARSQLTIRVQYLQY